MSKENQPHANIINPFDHILIVDDDPVTRRALRRIFRNDSYEIRTAGSGRDAIALLERESFSVVLTDLRMDDVDGLEVLQAAKNLDPYIEVIIVTGYGSVETAIEAIKNKAFHYVTKPLRAGEVKHITEQALDKRRLRLQIDNLQKQTGEGLNRIIGTSPQILKIKRLIRQIAVTDSNVLITGDSGTGKELVASAIHGLSARASKRFLPINCASFADDLIANELFGHEKGSFTGAASSRPGLLESADGGTIFFDEAGDMSPGMQSKLLRVIQERELLRVGGVQAIPVDLRIIAATNKNLKKAMELGTFREDLYYRLNVVPIHIPTLAERQDDISPLANHFLDRFNHRSEKKVLGFSQEAMAVLISYKYPGNVRELENIVERSAVLARSDFIEAEDLPDDLREIEVFRFQKHSSPIQSIEEMEYDYISWVLEQTNFNKSKAAELLGINRASLYRKLKKAQFKE